MTRSSSVSRAELSEWTAETLRVTTFHAPNFGESGEGWGKEVTGTDPDSEVIKTKIGARAATGLHGDGVLALNVQRREGRIDWILSIKPEVEAENANTKDALPKRIEEFSTVVVRWLPIAPNTKRI